jgi:hypothetical protein
LTWPPAGWPRWASEIPLPAWASRLELLKLGRRTSVPRHRSLRATLDWSYDLLSDIEKVVFRRISPFVGHFTLEGAEFVAGELGSSDGEIFDAIAGLVEKSLLTTRINETQVLYRLLVTTRAYELETAVKDWLGQPGPALLHVHVNPMQLVMPPFTALEPAIGMALYTTRAILHGRGGDVWEMVKENFI